MGWWDALWPVIAALIPSAGLGYLFYVIMKHILEADRRERAAMREWERQRAEERGDQETNGPGASDSSSSSNSY